MKRAGLWILLLILMSCGGEQKATKSHALPFDASWRVWDDLVVNERDEVRELSATFRQVVRPDVTWLGMQGTLTFYLNKGEIRSVAFTPEDLYRDEEAMTTMLREHFGKNRSADEELLEAWYQRDAKESWFRKQIPQDVEITLGSRLAHYWLYDGWVIATHAGDYPYAYIAFLTEEGFHFRCIDYFIEECLVD
ncbi:hypothetical protein [Entomospira culicis]|uniref:Lipoprotein n=1 Tax=Entomospira culicis TaxID=2719989 RepID=A0A968GJV2_9SPIO|nr:hypothetical protein [Entomospira culicis]NIZ19806.1 hypothetical protein [Entomospira culicis]NIZ70020.1 hypothetical protein [Entomospira culicis]WDI37126.1 hypothetical protein PVA46_07345 [Entomospira culicis]WDI38755.1 hypothetical protein PVA47_07355 [Entomospira culicis]